MVDLVTITCRTYITTLFDQGPIGIEIFQYDRISWYCVYHCVCGCTIMGWQLRTGWKVPCTHAHKIPTGGTNRIPIVIHQIHIGFCERLAIVSW